MTSYFDPVPVRRVPMFRDEVVGLDALDRLADVLDTLDPDPSRVTRSASPYTFSRQAGVHQVRLSMPFASRQEVQLFKKGDELVIEVGVLRRHVGLPQSMAGLEPRRARFEGDVLVVDLAEAQ
jgi:arsenite-transporting ATPase